MTQEPAPPATPEVAARARRKIARRVLPSVFILYVIAYLDRANVAFVNMPMSAALGFSEAVFGFGAGVFFAGYFLLEIPGALIVERWSARRWIARILVTWGLCTILVGFVRTPVQFYTTRFLLGAAEAGFFPGIIVYLTHWFSEKDRARAMAGFLIAGPVALAIGAPLSALILRITWLGYPGWRWVFILEGLPAILAGIVTLFYLTDHPCQAKWLLPEEREGIEGELARERAAKAVVRGIAWWKALRRRDVLILAAAYFCANAAGYGFIFWLPNTLKRLLGLPPVLSTLLSALPFAAAVASLLLVARASDRTGKRKAYACITLVMAAVFLVVAAIPGQPAFLTILWLCLTGAAVYTWQTPFWVLPTMILSDSAAAASIGLINSVGNLGGLLGPSVVGYVLSQQHSMMAMSLLSLFYLASAGLTWMVRVHPRDLKNLPACQPR